MRTNPSQRLLALGMLLAMLATGCVSWRSLQPVPPSVAAGRRLTRQGVAAMEVDRWDEAEELLRDAVEKSPEDPEAQKYLAEALWRKGSQSEAMQHMAIAAKFDRHDAATAVRAGEMLLATGDARSAISQADRAVKLDKSLAAAWTLRGRAYAAQGDLDRGLADLQRALWLAPNDPDVLLESAQLYHQRKQDQRCLATLHRLRDAAPPQEKLPAILQLEAETYLALHRPQLASDRIAEAVALSGPSPVLTALQTQSERQLGVGVATQPAAIGTQLR